MRSFKRAWLVARRELVDQLRDWRILMPMIVLTLFFPYLMNVTAKGAINYIQEYGGVALMGQRLLPFLILVVGYFPVTVSLVVALEAFVGEKERGTIEPLLTSPLADEELYMGKLMAGTLVPLTVSFIGISLYMAGLAWQGIKWPEAGFILQTLALTAVQTLMMVSAAIVVSTQSTTVRAANLLASFIVIPVGLLIQAESALMFWGTNNILWYAVLAVVIISWLIIRLGIVHFKRESLLGREIDMLSWVWVWKVFRKAFSSSEQPSGLGRYLVFLWKRLKKQDAEKVLLGQAIRQDWRELKRWYRQDITQTLRRVMPTFLITSLIGVAALLGTFFYIQAVMPQVALSDPKVQDSLRQVNGFFMSGGVKNLAAWPLFWHNFLAEVVIFALGIFSFGVLSILAFIGNFALIGGVLGALPSMGLSPWLVFVSGILPHGILELPSIMLLSAASLHMGLRMVTPDEGRSIGETLIMTIADVLKLLIAVCIPLLIVAAFIEANITPQILIATIGHALELHP